MILMINGISDVVFSSCSCRIPSRRVGDGVFLRALSSLTVGHGNRQVVLGMPHLVVFGGRVGDVFVPLSRVALVGRVGDVFVPLSRVALVGRVGDVFVPLSRVALGGRVADPSSHTYLSRNRFFLCVA